MAMLATYAWTYSVDRIDLVRKKPADGFAGLFCCCASGDAGVFHHIDHPRGAKPVLDHAVHR